MITVTLQLRVLQVEDGTWRIVLHGQHRDVFSLPNKPFMSREEAIRAIKSLGDIK